MYDVWYVLFFRSALKNAGDRPGLFILRKLTTSQNCFSSFEVQPIGKISSKKWKMIEKGEKAEKRAGKATTHENEMNGEIS